MEANSAVTPEGARPSRAVLHWGVLCLLALAATALAFAPFVFPPLVSLALALIFVFLLPGYLGDMLLDPAPRELALTRLPRWFVFSLAVWAIPATGVQLVGANWFTFRVLFVVILWALTLAACWRLREVAPIAAPRTREDTFVELLLIALGVLVGYLVMNGPRNGDDWLYLQVAQQLKGSNPFQILERSEARYSIRYVFHVWIFLQAYLGEWLHVDLVNLVREILPVLVSPLALVSFYAWGKTFFGRANAALLAVLVQLLIFMTFANGDGWGRGFFVRSTQDKFLVWLVVMPVAFGLAWLFLREGRWAQWVGYGAAMLAGLWVHPVGLFLVVLGLAGFALFNLISRVPFPRRRWLWLTAASLPALLSPLVIRATTLPAVFTVDTPEVASYLRGSVTRLLLQPPNYILDPTLLAQPLILFSLVVLVLFAPRLRTEPRVQFLWGATLVPLALTFNPWTARLLGEMLTPWQLWRLTWLVPSAFILTEGALMVRVVSWSPRFLRVALVLALVFVGAAALAIFKPDRSLVGLDDHSLPPSVEDVMRTLETTLTTPKNVLLPRGITRVVSAYTPYAVTLSNTADNPEDTRGQQIDRFYDPHADPKFLQAFLDVWLSDYVVAPNDSLQDTFLKTNPQARFLTKNDKYTLYAIQR